MPVNVHTQDPGEVESFEAIGGMEERLYASLGFVLDWHLAQVACTLGKASPGTMEAKWAPLPFLVGN
jgi:hypothetical protein